MRGRRILVAGALITALFAGCAPPSSTPFLTPRPLTATPISQTTANPATTPTLTPRITSAATAQGPRIEKMKRPPEATATRVTPPSEAAQPAVKGSSAGPPTVTVVSPQLTDPHVQPYTELAKKYSKAGGFYGHERAAHSYSQAMFEIFLPYIKRHAGGSSGSNRPQRIGDFYVSFDLAILEGRARTQLNNLFQSYLEEHRQALQDGKKGNWGDATTLAALYREGLVIERRIVYGTEEFSDNEKHSLENSVSSFRSRIEDTEKEPCPEGIMLLETYNRLIPTVRTFKHRDERQLIEEALKASITQDKCEAVYQDEPRTWDRKQRKEFEAYLETRLRELGGDPSLYRPFATTPAPEPTLTAKQQYDRDAARLNFVVGAFYRSRGVKAERAILRRAVQAGLPQTQPILISVASLCETNQESDLHRRSIPAAAAGRMRGM